MSYFLFLFFIQTIFYFKKMDWTAGLQAYNKSSPVVSRVSKT